MIAIIPPAAEIATKCDVIDRAARALLAACKDAPQGAWRYEAHAEAYNLFVLVVRHLEGVTQLARTDFSLLPPAMTAVRAALETAVRAAWLVWPADWLEREARFVAHLRGELDYLEKQHRMFVSFSGDAKSVASRAAQISSFADSLSIELAKRGGPQVAKLPTFRDCLSSIGEERVYLMYNWLSQYTHSTHASTWLYRTGGLGTERRFDEAPTADHWSGVMSVCRFVMSKPATLFLGAIGANPAELAATID